MNIVLDTSAAVHFLIAGPESKKISGAIADAEWVAAPDLMAAELANAFWKYHRFQHMPLPECEAAIARGLSLPDEFVPAEDLASEAFSLASMAGKPVYDAIFLVLARRLNVPLLTLDGPLKEQAAKYAVKTV